MLFVNFEEGAAGDLRERIGDAWKEYTVAGTPEAGKRTYIVYFYVDRRGHDLARRRRAGARGGNLDE